MWDIILFKRESVRHFLRLYFANYFIVLYLAQLGRCASEEYYNSGRDRQMESDGRGLYRCRRCLSMIIVSGCRGSVVNSEDVYRKFDRDRVIKEPR